MRLMEDIGLMPLNQQVIIQSNQGVPPVPSNIPLTTELPQQKIHFKQRNYSAMTGDPIHKLELKQALIKRVQDPERREQYLIEIKALQKEINNRNNKRKGD